MDYELVTVGALAFVRFPTIEAPHGSSTRLGGVSQAEFASLNLGYTTGDELGRVDENRDRLARALGIGVPRVLRMEHGAGVVRLDRPVGSERLTGDACITDRRGVSLCITTADCVPVVFYDPRRPAVGLAHAGWRGTVAGVARATVERMQADYGSRPQELLVGIAPGIGPGNFLVDEDVAQAFDRTFPGQELAVERGVKWSVDLCEANRLQLMACGVPAERISCARLCTAERSDLFFSYRRDRGRTGRMATAIAVT